MTTNSYLIIGRGVAGISAAREIRRLDPGSSIRLIGDEPYYYRASLSEWISGKTSDAMLPGRTQEFYRDLKLDQLDGRVREVQPGRSVAVLEDGRSMGYDRLLIATGANARRFPIPGLAGEESLVFRSLDDARTIREKAGCCGRVLILGGGVLGLELAGALSAMGGKAIAVVQLMPHMGAPLLDERTGHWVEDRMRAAGIEMFLEDTVEEVRDGTAFLKSGKSWPFDLFVQAVGVVPSYPEVPGLEAGRGIRIANDCTTSVEGIYAAGDCTETQPHESGEWGQTRIWLDCARQGKTAGRNMVEPGSAVLDSRPFYNASVLFDTFYSYLGEPNGQEGNTFIWESSRGFRKLRIVDGKLAGALFLGNRRSAHAVLDAVGKEVPVQDDGIAAPDYRWNDLVSGSWTYHFF